MPALAGKSAVVTGASQGIGQAIAADLHANGVRLALLGRSKERLNDSISGLPDTATPSPLLVEVDLADTASIQAAAEEIIDTLSTVDILVNCGGAYLRGAWDKAAPDTFTDLLATNVVGPYTLTRLLLPHLTATQGDVVFVNSSITRSPGINASHFKATQHALQCIADTLRAEFNERGIRILSIFPGRTATPRQESIFADEGREYTRSILLQPSAIASTITFCLSLSKDAEITDVHIRSRRKT